MIKKFFKDWTLFEKTLLFGSTLLIILITVIFNSSPIVAITSLVGIYCALFLAKGKVAGQFLGVAIVILYSYVSYQQSFYGEVLIYVFMMLPLYIYGIGSWLKNRDKETKIVIPNRISKKEWIIVISISLLLFVGFYFLLKYLNTYLLILSTLSIMGNLYALYLLARRSRYGFLFYVFDDIVLFIMWLIPVLHGNFLVFPMMFNPLINLANDIYGWINWAKLEKAKNLTDEKKAL